MQKVPQKSNPQWLNVNNGSILSHDKSAICCCVNLAWIALGGTHLTTKSPPGIHIVCRKVYSVNWGPPWRFLSCASQISNSVIGEFSGSRIGSFLLIMQVELTRRPAVCITFFSSLNLSFLLLELPCCYFCDWLSFVNSVLQAMGVLGSMLTSICNTIPVPGQPVLFYQNSPIWLCYEIGFPNFL